MADDLFSLDDNPVDPQVPEDTYNQLVGEGKKFKDAEALARAKWESDRFIERLTREKAELLEDYNKRLSAAEVAEQIREQLNQQRAASNEHNNQRAPERDDEQNTAQSPQDFEALIERKLSENQQMLLHKQNVETVKSTLEDKWGPNYSEHLRTKLKELGFDENFANGFAAEKPQAFLKLVMDKESNPNMAALSPGTSGIRGTPSTPSGRRTYKDFEKLRKENPSEYHSPRVQNELHKSAIEMGEAFYK